jgi:hypothetical protein
MVYNLDRYSGLVFLAAYGSGLSTELSIVRNHLPHIERHYQCFCERLTERFSVLRPCFGGNTERLRR